MNTKLTYAVETMYLIKAQLNKLDTFQLKGLRNITKMHTTYIDRANTSKEVRTRAANLLHTPIPHKGKGTGKGKGKHAATPPTQLIYI